MVLATCAGTVAQACRMRGSSSVGNFISSSGPGMGTVAGMAASPAPEAMARNCASGLPMASVVLKVTISFSSRAVVAEASRREPIRVEPAPVSRDDKGLPTSVQGWFSGSL